MIKEVTDNYIGTSYLRTDSVIVVFYFGDTHKLIHSHHFIVRICKVSPTIGLGKGKISFLTCALCLTVPCHCCTFSMQTCAWSLC